MSAGLFFFGIIRFGGGASGVAAGAGAVFAVPQSHEVAGG